MTKIETIPVLLSPDIGATSAFGTSLGFEVERFADSRESRVQSRELDGHRRGPCAARARWG